MNKTETKEKLAFISRGEKMLIESVAKQLKEEVGIESMVVSGDYGHGLYVDIKDYPKAIAIDFTIAAKDDRCEINWIDVDNIPHPVGFIPIMYGVLPQTRKGNELWAAYDRADYECPDDLRDYINRLREHCGVCDVVLEYNKVDNAFTIFVSAPFSSHELMVNRCRGFNYVNDYTPFIETYYPASDNSIEIDFEKVNGERTDNLTSYFYYSLFHDIIKYPQGANIAPHNDDYPHCMGSYSDYTDLSLNSIEVQPEDKLSIKGEFVVSDTKGIFCDINYCVVTDRGDFTSELSFSQNRVSITTTANVSRKVEGTDLDGQNHRDAFFTCLSGSGRNGTVVCNEHFVMISNGTRLLHYSDEFDTFEIFELPNNWFIENGLSEETTRRPRVFDDTTFVHDEDLNEVYEILNAKKKSPDVQQLLYK